MHKGRLTAKGGLLLYTKGRYLLNYYNKEFFPERRVDHPRRSGT